MRETVRRVLASHAGCSVVGEAETMLEAVRIARGSNADIALLDIDLALKESAPRLRRLAESFPRLHVVVMLNEDSDDYRAAVAERWGYSCVAKDKAEIDLRLSPPRRATADVDASTYARHTTTSQASVYTWRPREMRRFRSLILGRVQKRLQRNVHAVAPLRYPGDFQAVHVLVHLLLADTHSHLDAPVEV
jgi:chemotaxis response regulator CheB